jgi:hypothetical protein
MSRAAAMSNNTVHQREGGGKHDALDFREFDLDRCARVKIAASFLLAERIA